MSKKYMAYVGSYSYTGAAKGITVYDVDVQAGKFTKRCEVEVDNSSYVKASHSKKTLYSIADEGVVAFRIHEDGNISRLNSLNICGMRGCHISTDADDEYLFVSGYHDGKSPSFLSIQMDHSIALSMASITRDLDPLPRETSDHIVVAQREHLMVALSSLLTLVLTK